MSVRESPVPLHCYLCGGGELELIAHIGQRPLGETDFGVPADGYRRQIRRCRTCAVFCNFHQMLGDRIYTHAYNAVTYNHDLYENYKRIRSFPEERSDNKQRVRRVIEFNKRMGCTPATTRVLDVGSGLCVFLGELKERGFTCYCVDPDPLSVEHALEHASIDGGYAGTLDSYRTDQRFDLITFNKVLEHVPDPVRMLSLAKPLLAFGGSIYLELPDGEAAFMNGGAVDREEFYIEHFTIFTPKSLEYLCRATGLRCSESGQIHEPSDKYTLYAFLADDRNL